MFALATHPKAQKRLREEMLQVPIDTPTLDQLNALPYLDQVIREVLRLYTVISQVTREATMDDMIPLGKPVVDRNGNIITHIKYAVLLLVLSVMLTVHVRVQKGDQVRDSARPSSWLSFTLHRPPDTNPYLAREP